MLERRYDRGNPYFDTYYIYDTKAGRYIGIIEDHCRGVLDRYYIGIKYKDNHFIPNSFQSGKSKMCDSYEEALAYIQEEYERNDNFDIPER